MASIANVSTTLIVVLLSMAATLGSCIRQSVSEPLACAAVDGATARKGQPYPLCKCPRYFEKVFCESMIVGDRKFNLTQVLLFPGCYAPYCARKADPERTTTTTSTTTTTTTGPTIIDFGDSKVETTTSTTTTTTTGPTIIDFGDSKVKTIEGELFKCCCRSEVLSKPQESTSIVCELVAGGNTGCGQLKGRGYHSWNNMPSQYKGLKNFHECAIPPS
mmetsp:Transcript_132971/g.284210  ORF Transcript_132971/g.284210 Transcript_132971/m.284210 type:complete len:218 (-) Transcript_132971:18-671(-)